MYTTGAVGVDGESGGGGWGEGWGWIGRAVGRVDVKVFKDFTDVYRHISKVI